MSGRRRNRCRSSENKEDCAPRDAEVAFLGQTTMYPKGKPFLDKCVREAKKQGGVFETHLDVRGKRKDVNDMHKHLMLILIQPGMCEGASTHYGRTIHFENSGLNKLSITAKPESLKKAEIQENESEPVTA